VIKSWFEIKSLSDSVVKNPAEIRRECLWLNKNIKLNNRELKWIEWHIKGINIIHDIMDENGRFLTVHELETKYNIKCNVMNYNALKDAIPKSWRTTVKTMKFSQNSISFDEDTFLKLGTRDYNAKQITNKGLYWNLIGKIRIKPIFTEKLQQELQIEKEDWETIFTIPRVIANTKIKAFQYKLLFNLLPCNLYLWRIGRSDTNKCLACGKLEDIAHYLFECPHVVPYWNNFMRWWNNMTDGQLFLDKRSAITGFMGQIEYIQTLNACLLFAKWHVYKCKLNESEVFFYKFLCELKYTLDIEKIIALKNDKIQQYNIKWQIVENYIT
jgi:hypothetical protein